MGINRRYIFSSFVVDQQIIAITIKLYIETTQVFMYLFFKYISDECSKLLDYYISFLSIH